MESVSLLDRDLSILSFNERVLSWASRDGVPLLERLRYLGIVSSNLDEFFEVGTSPTPMDFMVQKPIAIAMKIMLLPAKLAPWWTSNTLSTTTLCCLHSSGAAFVCYPTVIGTMPKSNGFIPTFKKRCAPC